MKVQVFNANGLAGKAEEIMRFAIDNHIDICATLETWLSPMASVPLKPVVANVTQTNTGYIDGGHRNTGGILINAFTPAYHTASRLSKTALDGHIVIIDTNGVSFVFVYLPPSL